MIGRQRKDVWTKRSLRSLKNPRCPQRGLPKHSVAPRRTKPNPEPNPEPRSEPRSAVPAHPGQLRRDRRLKEEALKLCLTRWESR